MSVRVLLYARKFIATEILQFYLRSILPFSVYVYFNVNFNVLFKLIKVHLLVSELYIHQNARCNDKKQIISILSEVWPLRTNLQGCTSLPIIGRLQSKPLRI